MGAQWPPIGHGVLSLSMASGTDSSPSGEISDSDDLSFWKRRDLEFRVLIIGRANAGKTTILERLTGVSSDEAQITTVGEELLDGKVRRV